MASTFRDYVCDVSKASDIAKAHDKITADLGPVDILVNNAGTARTMAFENISDEAWQEDPRPQTVCRDPLLSGWSGPA
jgi:NAD(P)-dependent dehydrogenase (short-subunit alcohol dehydrogenase family)